MKDYQTNSSLTKQFNLSSLFNLQDLTIYLRKKTHIDIIFISEIKPHNQTKIRLVTDFLTKFICTEKIIHLITNRNFIKQDY